MRYLVTGASGWIGAATVKALCAAGHKVQGLARSEAAAAKISKLGAQPVEGSLDDLTSLRNAASKTDGVVHLAYKHDFSQMAEAVQSDLRAIDAFADELAGSGRPLLMASTTLGLPPGRAGGEEDVPDANVHPRLANATHTLRLSERGIRPIVVRFAASVHANAGDPGFVSVLAKIARNKGTAAFIEEGDNMWPAVHLQDAAALVALAIEKGEAGVLHAVAEEGIPTRDIAVALGSFLGVPTKSITADQASGHFGWMARYFGANIPATNLKTRQATGWSPSGPTLVKDIAAGGYPGTLA